MNLLREIRFKLVVPLMDKRHIQSFVRRVTRFFEHLLDKSLIFREIIDT